MPRGQFNSRVLRQLAKDFLRRLPGGEEIPEDELEDLATSLVRQWITYDSNATLFWGHEQVYAILRRTPLGKPHVVGVPVPAGWAKQLTEDWKVDPDELDDVFDQLTQGQGAEVVNSDGIPLRLWVNPKERSKGVEPLVKEDRPAGTRRDYRKVATRTLEQHLGEDLDAEEVDALACSVAKQWQGYEGHACLFLDGRDQLFLKLTEHGDGTCDVVAERRGVELGPLLSSLGFPPEALPEVIARINLGQEVEFRDGQGTPSVLWYDPRARRVVVRKLEPEPPRESGNIRPLLCPECTAVLSAWQERERLRTCPHCGHTISLS